MEEQTTDLEVYIIRHGQTVWNALGKLQGSVDIELNEIGREAAGELGRKLDNIAFDCIYCSPLIRAYETACLIRGHRNIPIIRDARLREISFGCQEGIHYTEWEAEDSPYRYFLMEPAKYIPPEGGETLAQVCMRTRDFLEEVVEPAYLKNRRIMIVAHGAVNKGLMCHIQGYKTDNFWGEGLQNNCEAAIFSYNKNGWKKI